jgi:hypothetical protein
MGHHYLLSPESSLGAHTVRSAGLSRQMVSSIERHRQQDRQRFLHTGFIENSRLDAIPLTALSNRNKGKVTDSILNPIGKEKLQLKLPNGPAPETESR